MFGYWVVDGWEDINQVLAQIEHQRTYSSPYCKWLQLVDRLLNATYLWNCPPQPQWKSEVSGWHDSNKHTDFLFLFFIRERETLRAHDKSLGMIIFWMPTMLARFWTRCHSSSIFIGMLPIWMTKDLHSSELVLLISPWCSLPTNLKTYVNWRKITTSRGLTIRVPPCMKTHFREHAVLYLFCSISWSCCSRMWIREDAKPAHISPWVVA